MTSKTREAPEPEDKEAPEEGKQRHFKSGLPAPTINTNDTPAKYELGDGSDPVPPDDPDSGIESEDKDLDEEAPDDEDNVPAPQKKPPAPRPKAKTPGKTW